jgi:secondary thiamine-phosphate synthase enzyme
MRVVTKHLSLHSRGETDVLDITRSVESAISETKVKDGIVTVFVQGSTGALTTIEYELGLLRDFPSILDRVVPKHFDYSHGSNGHSHIRASIIGPSITIPFKDARLTLGTWQQLVFVELDIRPRSRDLVLQIIGE